MTDTPSPKHVFMSYSRRDEAVMRRIATFLRNQDIDVWVDNEKLVPGTPIWEVEIEKAIRRAAVVVVLLSPDSNASIWVRREISFAERYKKRILPVLISGNEDSSIMLRLTTSQYLDIRENEDVALRRLTAAIIFHFKDLARRDQTERNMTKKVALESAKHETDKRTTRERAKRDETIKEQQRRLTKSTPPKRSQAAFSLRTVIIPVGIGLIILSVLILVSYFGFLQFSTAQRTNATYTARAEVTDAVIATSTARAEETTAAMATSTAKAGATVAAIATERANAITYAHTAENINYFYEEFNDNSNGWNTDPQDNDYFVGNRSVINGVYIWDIAEVKKTFVSRVGMPTNRLVKNFYFSVDIKLIRGDPQQFCYGAAYKLDSEDAYYLFTICDSQRYRMSYYNNGNWVVNEWKESSAIKAGDWNRIEVIVGDNTADIYINNTKVEESNDLSSVSNGYIELAMDVLSKAPGEIWFDNFLLEIRK